MNSGFKRETRRASDSVVDIRKRPITRARLIIILTDTYACQTCFIPITDYFRAFARLTKRLLFSSHLIRKQYISQCAPLSIQGTCVRSVHKVSGPLKIIPPFRLIRALQDATLSF